jgi:hypothetical protein
VIQLEFFPWMEFKNLSDFQKLEAHSLSLNDRRLLSQTPQFYQTPKSNDVIRREHAKLVDKILGFRQRYIEEMLVAEAKGFDPEGTHETWGPNLHQGIQTWVGLDLQTLQTPYGEIYRILQLLKIKPYQHVVDLGAAYGRMGVVIGGLYIKNSFTGYEYVKARVDEGNRVFRELGLNRCQLHTQDLFSPSFELPEADIYFIYDFGQVEHIDRTLKQIGSMSYRRPVKIVARGKYTKQIIEERHEWLNLQYEGKQEEFFSVYSAFAIS